MGLRERARATSLAQQDRKFLARDGEVTNLNIVSADGSELRDVRGRTYIDFVMGWCVGNLGWNRPEIRTRMQIFSGPSYVWPSTIYAPWVEVARLLAELTPGRLERCFRAVGGTEAVEIALQLARAYTGRHRVIAIADAYHGNSTAAKALERPIRPPLDERALHRLERVLAAGEVAALIMEPIITNLGVEVPTAEFMTGMASLCAKHRTLVIADEVATGFGRTGTVFACEQYGLVPDVLCLAKALTNGAAPMGATITTATIADKASRELAMYSTYGWHPLACEAALEVLETWRRDETVLLAQVAERSEQFQQRLLAMRMPAGTAVRIRGLAIGIDLPEGAEAATVIDACLERGLVIAGEDNQLTLFPALTIDRGTADAGLDILQSCFER